MAALVLLATGCASTTRLAPLDVEHPASPNAAEAAVREPAEMLRSSSGGAQQ